MLEVTHADRIVFPEVDQTKGRTKGDVVAYYDRIAARALPHLVGRPLSIKRYPKGIGAPGFFQKNVPAHYPRTMARVEVPRREEGVTVYPVLAQEAELPYLANQGAIELHVPAARATELGVPDRVIVDLDPPSGAVALVRRAARLARDALAGFGLQTVPVATGSKGYHLVAAIHPTVGAERLGPALHKFATLLAAAHPDELTTVFRVAGRGRRVFLDWLRVMPLATAVAPYSLRARPRATVAAPLSWDELDALAPDAFTIADADRLLDRPDTVAEQAQAPADAAPFVAAVDAAFADSGLVLETFDRFRS